MNDGQVYMRDGRIAARLKGQALVSTRSSAGILHNSGDPAIAFDETVLAEAKQDGATLLIVFIRHPHATIEDRYEVRLRVMEFHGERRKFPAGWQKVLPIKFWSVNGQPPVRTVVFPDERPPAPENPQGSLF